MAKETKKMKEMKTLAEELYEILAPEDEETGEEMEMKDFLLNGNKKLTEKNLEESLVEFCEALAEEDEDEVTPEIISFMKEHDIELPWGEIEAEDDDEEEDEPDEEDEDEDEEEEPEDEDDEEDDDEDETPNFDKMSVPELKAFAKEHKIKGIAGKKKEELVKLIELEWIQPSEEEPDDPEDDDIEDDDEEESEYADVSDKDLKKLLKKAGHSPKAIKKMERDEMIGHLEAADEEEDEEDDDEEEEKELTLEEQLNETTKLSDLKDMVDRFDEFKKIRKKAKKISGLQGPRELKPLMYKALGIEPPAKQKRKAKTKKAPAYTRADAVVDTIKKIGKKGFTMSDLLSKSDDLYVEKTNSKSNPTATNVCNHITAGLIGFDIIEKDGKTYKLNK